MCRFYGLYYKCFRIQEAIAFFEVGGKVAPNSQLAGRRDFPRCARRTARLSARGAPAGGRCAAEQSSIRALLRSYELAS